jgi:hypothetical protein
VYWGVSISANFSGCEPPGVIPDDMPTITNITLRGVRVVDATFAYNLQGLSEMPSGGISGLTMVDVDIRQLPCNDSSGPCNNYGLGVCNFTQVKTTNVFPPLTATSRHDENWTACQARSARSSHERIKTDDADRHPSWTLATAASSYTVLRTFLPYQPASETSVGVEVEMAQNEVESSQLVVIAAAGASAHNLTWSLAMDQSLEQSNLNVSIHPYGAIHSGPCGFDVHDGGCPAAARVFCAQGMRETCHADNNGTWDHEYPCWGRAEYFDNLSTVGCSQTSNCCIGCSLEGSPLNNGGEQRLNYTDSRGLYPYPWLDFMDTIPLVRAGEAQPLAIVVTSTAFTKPGVYTGRLTVLDEHALSRHIAVKITVRGFAIPTVHHLPTLWGSEERTPRTAAMILAHRLPAGFTVYGHLSELQAVGSPTIWRGFYQNVTRLRLLWEQGQRVFVTSGWSGQEMADCARHPQYCPVDGVAPPQLVHDLSNGTAQLDAAGWPRKNQYVYLSDEVFGVSRLPELSSSTVQKELTFEGKKADLIAKIAPGAVTVATGQGMFFVAAVANTSEAKPGGRLANIALYIPYCYQLVNSSWAAGAQMLRSLGKRVGCYAASDSGGDFGVDFGMEYPALRARLLMGASMWKTKVDAFLYYGVSEWEKGGVNGINAYNDGYRMSWSDDLRAEGFMNAAEAIDAEGQLALPGPNNSRWEGILTTTTLQAIRDGLEDYEMYAMLQRLVDACAEAGIEAHAEASAMEVPSVVFAGWPMGGDILSNGPTQRFFTDDPYVIRWQWRKVATAIESLQTKLARRRMEPVKQ